MCGRSFSSRRHSLIVQQLFGMTKDVEQNAAAAAAKKAAAEKAITEKAANGHSE
jgi:hypothetical protein